MSVGTNSKVLDHQNPTAEDERGKFKGRYMGFVMDRNDPQKRGRVRCACPAILPGPRGSADFWLDWALPVGSWLAVPKLGSPVWLTFENGQITDPIYEAGWFLGDDAASSAAPAAGTERSDATFTAAGAAEGRAPGPEIANEIPADTATAAVPNYPDNICWEEDGWRIELDRTAGKERARFRHPSGTTVLIDPDGSLHFRSKGAQYFEPEGDFVVQLKTGATYKVLYPKGAVLSLGASGVTAAGPQVSVQGRAVKPGSEPI